MSQPGYSSQLAHILESMSDSFFSLDSNWRFTYINNRMETQLHLKRNELLGGVFWELFPFAQYDLVSEELKSVMQKRTPSVFKTYSRRLNAYLDVSVYPSEDGGLEVFFRCSDNHSVEQCPVEETYRHISLERTIHRLAQDFIHMPFQDINNGIEDAVGMVCDYYNAQFASVWIINWESETVTCEYEWNKVPGEFPNRKGRTLLFSDAPLPPGKEWGSKVYQIVTSAQFPESNRARTELPEQNIRHLKIYPILSEGRIIGVFSHDLADPNINHPGYDMAIAELFCQMLANVILRKKQEESLRNLEESYRLILNSTNEAIVMCGREGDILVANKVFASRFSRGQDEMAGLNMGEFFPEHLYENLFQKKLAVFQRVYDTGIPESYENAMGDRVFRYRVYPAMRNGRIYAVTVFSNDVTGETKALEDTRKAIEYQARLKVMTEFFTNISHEFKTPLTLILNSVEMTEIRFQDVSFVNKDKVMKYLLVMRQNAHRLLRLVGNLLDVTKADAGFLTIHLQEIEVGEWMMKLVASVEEFAAHRGIKVCFRDDALIHTIPMDGSILDRIMLNLLSNAIKHTCSGGSITVTISGEADELLITVSDEGEGIPEDKKELIFNRFRQVNTSLTRSSEGSGLGLALTKALVELLGGRIWFDSRVGRGTDFYVALPVVRSSDTSGVSVRDGLALKRKVEMELSDIL